MRPSAIAALPPIKQVKAMPGDQNNRPGFFKSPTMQTTLLTIFLIAAMTHSGHQERPNPCPLLGVKRTSFRRRRRSANDPKRTSCTSLSTSLRPVDGPSRIELAHARHSFEVSAARMVLISSHCKPMRTKAVVVSVAGTPTTPHLPRTSSTGLLATCVRPSATLPSSRRRIPRRPWVPITIKSARHRLASCSIAS